MKPKTNYSFLFYIITGLGIIAVFLTILTLSYFSCSKKGPSPEQIANEWITDNAPGVPLITGKSELSRAENWSTKEVYTYAAAAAALEDEALRHGELSVKATARADSLKSLRHFNKTEYTNAVNVSRNEHILETINYIRMYDGYRNVKKELDKKKPRQIIDSIYENNISEEWLKHEQFLFVFDYRTLENVIRLDDPLTDHVKDLCEAADNTSDEQIEQIIDELTVTLLE